MPTNVSEIHTLVCDLRFKAKDLRAIQDRDLPENNSFAELKEQAEGLPADEWVPLVTDRFLWHDGWSGRSWGVLLDLLKKSKGRFEAAIQWDNGGSPEGLRAIDGVVTEPRVTLVLAPE